MADAFQLQRDRVAALLAELEQETGPIEPELMEEVRRAWPAPGEQADNPATKE